jgi:flagellar FliJ protein
MFQFRLETLLRLRLDDRDKRRGELAEAYEAERVLELRINETDDELVAVNQRTREIQASGTVNIDAATERQRYQLILKSQLQSLKQQTEQVGVETEKRKQALIEADREVKKFEQLKENQRTVYDKEQLMIEVKNLDEVATMAHARKRSQ